MSRTAKPKTSTSRSARRREELRRTLPKPEFDLLAWLQRPDMVSGTLIVVLLMIVSSLLVVWSREQIRVTPGQIMTGSHLKRLDYKVPDTQATESQREEARLSAPQVWMVNGTYLDRLEADLNGLPKAVAGKQQIDEITPELRSEFQLTNDALVSLQAFAINGETTPRWKGFVNRLIEALRGRRPLIARDEYQNRWAPREYSKRLERLLRDDEGKYIDLENTDAIEITPEMPMDPERLSELVALSGFPPSLNASVTARLASNPSPTLLFDAEQTEALARTAAANVKDVFQHHKQSEVVYARGERLNEEQRAALQIEHEMFTARAPVTAVWLPRFGVVGLCMLLIGFVSAYVSLTYPRITRNWLRVGAICVLLASMLTLTAVVTSESPALLFPATLAPILFVAIVVRLAYDQRLALLLSGMQAVLVTLALGAGIGWLILLVTGCGTVIAQLREIRHRASVVRAATVTAAVLGVGTLTYGLLEVPMVQGAWREILYSAVWAITASFGVGFLVLGILPSIERLFDITTGMTLTELRDPKQPLLRQLQQKAPGTYNHSLQVANIADAAAEAIGADSLLVYVGALYHDIGKMNKPGYFVENQVGGENKHDKLSPAMSLLVIVGHVKDGVELAKEYGLPRQLQHFIESHHGTTLVEYFYHAAKTQAEADEKTPVEEVEFRYPGPKPHTKEAAILMIADAMESATRAMTDPTPGRIETLVRTITRKRLTDGQFDQCQLTFGELGLIEESVISRLCAIHHSRISYPTEKSETESDDTPQTQTA
jgi:hypothetical protein